MDLIDLPMNTKMEQIQEKIDDIPPETNDKYVLAEFHHRRKKEKEKKEILRKKKLDMASRAGSVLIEQIRE